MCSKLVLLFALLLPQFVYGLVGNTRSAHPATTTAQPSPPSPTSGPLFGQEGVLTCDDIERKNIDVYLTSTLCAIVMRSPAWITSKMTFTGDFSFLTEASVTVHDANVAPHVENVQWKSVNEMNDNSGPIWWPGAVLNALIQMGVPWYDPATKIWTGGSPGLVMQMITGYAGLDNPAGNMTPQAIWDILSKADYTPIVFGGERIDSKILEPSSCYAVKTAYIKEGTSEKMVSTWRDRGQINEYKFTDIVGEITYISHLTNFDAYTG